jgi:Cellulase (glycosyl hydrolase family 5)
MQSLPSRCVPSSLQLTHASANFIGIEESRVMKKVLVVLLVLIAAAVILFQKKTETTPDKKPDVPRHESTGIAGINIGHWLSDELQFDELRYLCDQPTAYEILHARFGGEEADRLLERYREGFLRVDDVAAVRASGFASIRVPVSAAALYDRPGGTARLARVAARIDWLLKQAETYGLSVVLNLAVRPGQWAMLPPVNGKRMAAVWSERDVVEAAAIWSALAKKYAGSTVLAGYDLSPGPCQAGQNWNEAFIVWSKAILASDTNHVIYAPWPLAAARVLAEDPEFNGKQFGFTADFLSDNSVSASPDEAVKMLIEEDAPRMANYWREHGIHHAVSAFNPSIIHPVDSKWPAIYRGVFKRDGWRSFLWTLKSLRVPGSPEKSTAVLSGEFGAITLADLSNASKETIESSFDSLAQITTVTQMALLAETDPASLPAAVAKKSHSAPDNQAISEQWISSALGPVEKNISGNPSSFTIISSGLGPENNPPEFTFVHQIVSGPADLGVTINESAFVSSLAGAGLMVRESLDEKSPYILVYRAYDGRIRAIVSNRHDQPAMKRILKNSEGSKHLRIIAGGMVLKASCSTDGFSWPVAENFSAPWLTNSILAGCAVFGGHEYRTAEVTFNNLKLNLESAP